MKPAKGPVVVTASKTRANGVPISKLSEEHKKILATPAGFARGFLGLKLYPDQERILNDMAPSGSRVAVRTCNESGKTQMLIAPFILWHSSVFSRGLVVSTSGSWAQVSRQLSPRLRQFSGRFPQWDFTSDSITCNGAPKWIGFSTNNPGQAEGYHGSPDAPLAALVDEAKTVADEIVEMLDVRCNPQRMAMLSSPGFAQGAFYRSQLAGGWKCHKITADQCPHITPESIARRRALFTAGHMLVRSALDAEFMEVVEGALLSLAKLEACRNAQTTPTGDERHAFLDFAAGGDENVLAVRRGNRVWIPAAWRDSDTMAGVGRFIVELNRLKTEIGLLPEEVEGDADGLGKPMCDRLREAGWPIQEFHGAAPPLWGDQYVNRIAENWHEGVQAIERGQIILPDDGDLTAQLINRKIKINSRGKMGMESKDEMKARGVGSPDRADAVLGAMMIRPVTSSIPFSAAVNRWAEQEEEMRIDAGVLAGMDAGQ